ncbi:glycosyltransferase [Gordonibacter massiliensis]|nr:glycosyltransferase [Gordonibacter massiliensis (ex Traore et al. 2017)]
MGLPVVGRHGYGDAGVFSIHTPTSVFFVRHSRYYGNHSTRSRNSKGHTSMESPKLFDEPPAVQPKLSIVVPCYNTAQYLPRCLDSLVAQTLDGIEAICVNDGSPDTCLAIMGDYAKRHPGLFRIVDKQNGGLWNARWSGTDVANGEYVAYLDSDDYVAPTFAEELYATAVRHQADIVICGFEREEEGTGKVTSREMDEERAPFKPSEDPGRLVEVNPAAWNKAFRRTLLMRMHRLEEPPTILEDVTLTQLAYLSAVDAVAFTGTAPYHYMIRNGSMINSVTPEQIDSVKRALLEVRRHFENSDASEELLQELDAIAFLHLGVSMSFRLSCNSDADLGQAVAETTEYLNEHFPSWKASPYINLAYAKKGSAYSKLLIAQGVYKMHLMKPFLATYRFAIEKLHVDIKW